MDEKDESPKVPRTPEGLVIYDPENLGYQKMGVCMYLRKVNDAQNGDPEALVPPDPDHPY